MRILIALFLLLALNCFSQSQPAIYLTQPYIGNGLSQAQNNFQAQTNIGINGAGVSNVVANAITNGDLRNVSVNGTFAVSNNFNVTSQQGNASGGTSEINADSGTGGFDGGIVKIHANATDINTSIHSLIISSTNSADSSWGEIDLMAGNIYVIGSLNLAGAISPLGAVYGFTGSFFGNGQWVTNVQTTNIVGQVLLSSLTNAGTLWTNVSKFNTTNSGFQITNNIVNTSNVLANQFSANVFIPESAITNITLAGTQIAPQNTNVIKLVMGATNYLFNQSFNGLWTNAVIGYVTNALGINKPYQFYSSGNTLQSSSTNIVIGNWILANGVLTPSSSWGAQIDGATSGLFFTNVQYAVNAQNSTYGAFGTASGMSSNAVVQVVTNVPLVYGTSTNVLKVVGSPLPQYNTTYFYDGADSSDGVKVWTNVGATVSFWDDANIPANVLARNKSEFDYDFIQFNRVPIPALINFTDLNTVPWAIGVYAKNSTSALTPSLNLTNLNVQIVGDQFGNPAYGVLVLSNLNQAIIFDVSPDHHGVTVGQNQQLTGGGSVEQFALNLFALTDARLTWGLASPDVATGLGIEGNCPFIQAKNFNFTNRTFIPTDPSKPYRFVFGFDGIGKTLEMVSTAFRTNGNGEEVTGQGGVHIGLPNIYSPAYMGWTNTTAGYLLSVDPNTNFTSFYPQWNTNGTDSSPEGMFVRSNSASGSSGAHYWFLRSGEQNPQATPNTPFAITSSSNSIPVAVTVGASAFLFTNTTTSILRCAVGDTTSITTSIGVNGVTVNASTTDLNLEKILGTGEYLTLTYSGGTPTLFTNRLW